MHIECQSQIECEYRGLELRIWAFECQSQIECEYRGPELRACTLSARAR